MSEAVWSVRTQASCCSILVVENGMDAVFQPHAASQGRGDLRRQEQQHRSQEQDEQSVNAKIFRRFRVRSIMADTSIQHRVTQGRIFG